MKAAYILVRHSTGQQPYLLEISHDGRPVGCVSVYVHIVYDIIQLALLLDAPIHLWVHNPPEVDRAVREYAAPHNIEVVKT